MPLRKTRYSSSLAADWVVPTPVADEAMETNREDVSDSKSPSNSIARPSRYKKVLPVDWIGSNTDTRRSDAHVPESLDLEHCDTPNDKRSKGDTRHTHVIDTSIPKKGNSGYTPPPAPTFPPAETGQDDRFFGGLPSETVHSNRRARQPQRDSTEPWPEAEQPHLRADGATREQPSHHEATISPPISVGQLSSTPTTSPFHGQDLPVRGPAMSPSYSVV